MHDLVCILGSALRAGGQDISNQLAGQMQCEGGVPALTRALVDLLQLTFGGLDYDTNTHSGEISANPT
jgi:hypothetical protein